MVICNKCGKRIHSESGVQRVVRTGAHSSGGGFFRNVNLCGRCDQAQNRLELSVKVKKALVVCGTITALIGGFWAYLAWR